MIWGRLTKAIAAYLWTLMPMYGVERLANYYFLNRDPTFYLISGWRLEAFIIFAFVCSIAAGKILKEFRLAVATQVASLASFFIAVYYLCDPHVCYSAGPDGFEALRFGLFLAAVAVSGGAIGTASKADGQMSKWETALTASAGFYAVAYYPTVFIFAGTRLLSPLDPWSAAAVLFMVSFATAMRTTNKLGRSSSFTIPVACLLVLLTSSAGIAFAYLGGLGPIVSVIVLATVAGAGAGANFGTLQVGRKWTGWPDIRILFAVSILLVMLMTLVIVPDAVSGVLPGPTNVSDGTLLIGTPVYAGAYQASPPGHTDGAGITVSFSGTNPLAIQESNFLSAGIGIHSPDCCVDGIDYSYRFDSYLFHGGNVSVVASGWQACDSNAACGGHSWKVLLTSRSKSLGAPNLGQNISLRMQWANSSLLWSYSQGGGPYKPFSAFAPPPHENHHFNTGVLGGFSLSSQKDAYFFQFGLMSRYPIGQTGWKVNFACPSTLANATWICIPHAATLRGLDSYWKGIWRWGEDYQNIYVSPAGVQSAIFEYSTTGTTPSSQILW